MQVQRRAVDARRDRDGRERACEGHDDLAGQGDAGALDSHQQHDAEITAAGDDPLDPFAESR